jgi:predicted metalloendopeptidase
VGLSPLRNILKEFGDWPLLVPNWEETNFNLLKAIGEVRRRFLFTVIFNIYVDQDLRSADNNVVFIDQPSLVLPRDMLINEGGAYDDQIAAYKQFIINLANELAAADDATPTPDPTALAAAADDLIAFEAAIATITTRDQDRSNYDRMYNNYTLDKYQEIVPDINFKELLDIIFSTSGVTIATTEKVIVLETTYVTDLDTLLKSAELATVSNYLNLRIVSGLATETTNAMRDHAFKFNQVLTGAREPPTREKTCADGANNGLGMAIGVKYIEQKFDDKAKTEVNELVEDLRVSFKEILVGATWMDDSTRALAQGKADKMKSFMAYPDWLDNKTEVERYFEGLEILEQNHFVSTEKLSHWSGDKVLKTLRTPVDRNFWLTYPGIVNAFYAPTYNSITFPAGILQPPFFKSGYPSFLNYGGIGVVIGHEITHGFDNSGRQFDALGNAFDWWTPETSENYDGKAKCIEDQYSSYKVMVEDVEMSVDGLLTLGENIADNGGLREAFIAYQKFVEENGIEQRLPGLEQFEPEQLFFMGYANIWCENITPAGLRNQLLTDPHSPARFRIKGPLTNNEDFSTKWNCPAGSGMNPNPDDRCILW